MNMTDRDSRWIIGVTDNQIEGLGQEREISIQLISDTQTGYKFLVNC
jgi:hypothetical protein